MANDARSDLCGLRVGFVTSVTHMGGSEVLFADAIEATARSGAEVICWCDPTSAIREIIGDRSISFNIMFADWPPRSAPAADAARVTHPVPAAERSSAGMQRLYRSLAPASLKKLAGYFKECRLFEREVRRLRPDVLVVNVDGSEPACLAGARHVRKGVISCYHLSVCPSRGSLADRIVDRLKKTTSIWASSISVHTSHSVRDQWCRLCLYPLKRTRIINNGVDDYEGYPLARQQVLGSDSDRFVFCVPGRLHPFKGHRYLLDALALNPIPFEQCLVLICGDGPARDELEQRCRAEGLQQIVRFLGWRNDLPQILRSSDCTVLPSIASENASVAVLESLMAGTPAIVTSVGGMAEVVRHQITGLVVPPASGQALHDAMRQMMTDRIQTKQLGAQARQDALVRFTRTRMMAEYVELLKAVTAA